MTPRINAFRSFSLLPTRGSPIRLSISVTFMLLLFAIISLFRQLLRRLIQEGWSPTFLCFPCRNSEWRIEASSCHAGLELLGCRLFTSWSRRRTLVTGEPVFPGVRRSVWVYIRCKAWQCLFCVPISIWSVYETHIPFFRVQLLSSHANSS